MHHARQTQCLAGERTARQQQRWEPSASGRPNALRWRQPPSGRDDAEFAAGERGLWAGRCSAADRRCKPAGSWPNYPAFKGAARNRIDARPPALFAAGDGSSNGRAALSPSRPVTIAPGFPMAHGTGRECPDTQGSARRWRRCDRRSRAVLRRAQQSISRRSGRLMNCASLVNLRDQRPSAVSDGAVLRRPLSGSLPRDALPALCQ